MQSRQSLELRQHQQLALTPQLQQSIRFLQLSAYELEQEVAQAVQENPLLESGTDSADDAGDTVAEVHDDTEEHWATQGDTPRAGSSDDDPERPEAAGELSLRDHLLEQLRLTRAQPRDAALVGLLIDELDENGYLLTPIEEVLDILPAQLEVSLDELNAALRLLQSFDPPGVGARTLAECLCLQLNQQSLKDNDPAAQVVQCAKAMAREHLDLLASASLQRLRSALNCSDETLRAAHALLLSLEPRPGRHWATSVADFAVPDVIARKQGGRWVVSVNPAVMPRVRVNAAYAKALEGEPSSPLQAQLQQAYGLVKSVSQRFATVLRVAQAIVDRQQAFFEEGLGAMRPLVLRDIADLLEMHESTISRATKQKYIQTPWGVLELKRFFGSAVQTDDGESTSATAVQTLIRRLVDQEPPGKPLSDNQLATALARQGVTVARRTVAKYREAAGIAPASVRKARAALDAL
jgi:RNA polymerase sigma-54 factor